MPEPRPVSSRYPDPSPAGYELLEPLSRGRVTQAWRARAAHGGDCVVKFPVDLPAGQRGAAQLIEREWAFLGRAAQVGVVRVLDRFETDTGPALVTEFLPGGSLVALAGSHPSRWAPAMLDVLGVVAELHRRGIVHRDLKPANVLLDEHDRATVIDFALAGAIGSPCRIGGGTSAYRRERPSPAEAVEPADDIHALAVTVYELICGRLPFGQAPAAHASAAARAAALACLKRAGVDAGPLAEAVRNVLVRPPADPAAALEAFRAALRAIITAYDR